MTTVGPVPPALPPVPTPTATTGATSAVGLGAVPTPSAPTVTANAVQALTAIVVNLPNTLRNRPVGSPIVGTLVAQDSEGTALLRTAEGIVVLRGPIAAQIGSQLALYLPDQAEGATARLVLQRLPDGTPATGVTSGNTTQASTSAPEGGSSTPPPATAQRPAPATLAPGQVVTATLVQRGESAPAGANGAAAGYARAPIGAAFEARVLSIADAAGAPAQGGSMGINADGHPVVTATVVGRTTAGLVAINAGFGLLTVPAGGDLQPGQRLELELIGRPAAPAPSNAPAQAVVATLAQRGDPALASANAVASGYARAPIGTTIRTNVLSIANANDDGASAGTISVNAQGNPVVTATVTGRTSTGVVTVNAGFGQLTMPASLNLLAGQRLQIELVGRPRAAPVAPTPNEVVTATLIQRSDAPAPAAGPAAGYARAAIGTTFDARVLPAVPGGGDAAKTGSIAVNAEGHPVVTASVVGRTGGGLTVVNAGFGLLTLPAGGNLQPGQPVALELLGRPSAPAEAPDTGPVVTATLVQRGDQALATANPIAQTYARAPIGTTIEARLLLLPGTADDGLAAGTIAVNAEGNPVVTGTAIGRTGAGLLVVNAGFGLLTVAAGSNAQPGQRVQLELVGRAGAPLTALTPGQVVAATLVQRGEGGPPVVNGAAQGYVRAPVGATFEARVLSIGGPAGAAPNIGEMSINAEGHPVVTATVVGRSAGGLLVVNAGFGLLTMPAGELPVGQRVQLELLGRPGLATAPAAAAKPGAMPLAADDPAAAGDAVTLAHDWENLRRAIEGLAASDPTAAQTALGRAIAQPGQRMAAGLLFLVAALRGGDIGMLLGERAVRSLERTGRGALLGRLSEELGVLNRLATQPSGDWRAFFLPVQHPEGPITPVRMFFRQQRNRKGQLEPTTRFVVETELTRLGPLQIDGLARAQRVDLVLRTRETLPEEARRDIDTIVQSAAAEGRFAGSIAFQAGGRFPIDPLDEIGHPAHGVTA